MRAIVLSGGGAKGAYQVGVWQALRKLKIDYDIVTGTSIGAVNGLMMVQKDYWKTVLFWKNISFNVLYDVDFPNKNDTLLEKTEIYKQYVTNFLKNGGISMDKMKKLMSLVYNEKKFYKSNIDYGIMTYNLTKMKPLSVTKKEMRKDLIDYVLASACCYPAFQKQEIKGEKFVDGGCYDVTPINLAIELGAREVIAIELDAIGIRQPIKDKTVKIKYIRPRNDIGSMLVFDKKIVKKAIKYGYYDTMKEYSKLDGNIYTFKKEHLNNNYSKYHKPFIEMCKSLFKEEDLYKNILKLSLFWKIFKTNKKDELKNVFNDTLEFLGKLYEIDDTKIYNIIKYNQMLIEKNNLNEEISKDYIEEKIATKKIKEIINTSSVVKYLYNNIDNKDNNKLILLASFFPKEFLGAIYLKVIEK